MAEKKKVKKATKKEEEYTPFEKRDDLKKLVFYIVIVNYGQGDNVIRLFKNRGSTAQFVQMGEGTANSKVKEILNIEDTRKEIVTSIVREDRVKEIKDELEAYFAASSKNRGVGFTVELGSIVGVKIYKFFTQTIRG